jgi:hypothetical protein
LETEGTSWQVGMVTREDAWTRHSRPLPIEIGGIW